MKGEMKNGKGKKERMGVLMPKGEASYLLKMAPMDKMGKGAMKKKNSKRGM